MVWYIFFHTYAKRRQMFITVKEHVKSRDISDAQRYCGICCSIHCLGNWWSNSCSGNCPLVVKVLKTLHHRQPTCTWFWHPQLFDVLCQHVCERATVYNDCNSDRWSVILVSTHSCQWCGMACHMARQLASQAAQRNAAAEPTQRAPSEQRYD